MVTASETETVRYGLLGVITAKGAMGIERQCDVLFTENGMVFAVTASGLKMAAQGAAVGGFGLVGGLAWESKVNADTGQMREQFRGKTIPQILSMNEKSMYLAYSEISQVSLKKGMIQCKMEITVPDGKYRCQFSKDQFDVANAAILERLGTKVKS